MGGVPAVVDYDAKTYSLNVDHLDRLFLGSGSQLLRSADRARTWTLLDDGLDGMSVYAMQEGPDGRLVVATNVGMFISANGGDSWTGRPNPAVQRLSISSCRLTLPSAIRS